MTEIKVAARPNFSAWLRRRGMVRHDSHQVARDPSRWWWICVGSDGWVRAVAVEGWTRSPPDWVRHKVSRAGIVIVSVYRMRFKRLPRITD